MQQFNDMEHRLASRSEVEVEAAVELGGGRTVNGTIRNVSLTGLYVEIPRVDVGALHGPIRATFALPRDCADGSEVAVARWQGFVVRRDESGIGAMFDSDEEEDWEGLAELLGIVNPWSSRDRQLLRRCLEHVIGE